MVEKVKQAAGNTRREERHVAVVRELLMAYAARGVLREFEERSGRNSKTEYTFTWLLDRRFSLIFDPGNSQLTLRDLLPGVPVNSAIHEAVNKYVAGSTSKQLPTHRRVDPAKATLGVTHSRSSLSLVLKVKRNQYGYAVPKLLNFCNELFGHLDMYHIQYLWEHMGVPEE